MKQGLLEMVTFILMSTLVASPAESLVGQVGQGQNQTPQHGCGNFGGVGVELVSKSQYSQYQAYSCRSASQDPFLPVLAKTYPE